MTVKRFIEKFFKISVFPAVVISAFLFGGIDKACLKNIDAMPGGAGTAHTLAAELSEPVQAALTFEYRADAGEGAYYIISGIDYAETELHLSSDADRENLTVTVPATYNDGINGIAEVREIAGYAFKHLIGNSHDGEPKEYINSVYTVTGADFSGAENLRYIGEGAFGFAGFYNCGLDLTGTALRGIGNSAFYGSGISFATLSGLDKLKRIENWAFSGCVNNKKVDLSGASSLEYIGAFAFCLNKSLTELNARGLTALTEIDNSAFAECANLKEISFADSPLRRLGMNAFANTGIGVADLRIGTLEEIGNYLFTGCHNLTTVYIGDIERIGKNTLKNCGDVLIVTEAELVEAYWDCGSLTQYASRISCETEVSFYGADGAFIAKELKLLGQSFKYVKDADGGWYIDDTYELPYIEVDDGYYAVWSADGETSLTDAISSAEYRVLLIQLETIGPENFAGEVIAAIATGAFVLLVAGVAVAAVILRKKHGAAVGLPETLTTEERQLAGLILEGKTRKEIATVLFMSPDSVKKKTAALFLKTECAGKIEFIIKYLGTKKGGTDEETYKKEM